MLEDADHQHPVVARNDVFGAVAVVYVEVGDDHPFKTVHVQRTPRGDGDVVADIFRTRVMQRGKGSEVWGWGTAYGKPTGTKT